MEDDNSYGVVSSGAPTAAGAWGSSSLIFLDTCVGIRGGRVIFTLRERLAIPSVVFGSKGFGLGWFGTLGSSPSKVRWCFLVNIVPFLFLYCARRFSFRDSGRTRPLGLVCDESFPHEYALMNIL